MTIDPDPDTTREPPRGIDKAIANLLRWVVGTPGPEAEETPALADFWLRQALEAELPILTEASADPLEKIERLRSWVRSGTVSVSAGVPPLSDVGDTDARFGQPAAAMFRAFAERHEIVAVGGEAYAFLILCRLFGFDGFVCGFGDGMAGPNRVFAVVVVGRKDGTLFSVHDARAGETLVDERGRAVDFFELLARLHDGGAAKFLAAGIPAEGLRWVLRPSFITIVGTVPGSLIGRLLLRLLGVPIRRLKGPAALSDEMSRETAEFWFRRYVEIRHPELADPSVTQTQKARILRDFTYAQVNRAPSDPAQQLPKRWGDDYYLASAPELFRAFLLYEGGTYCHGNAYALLRICGVFGMDAFIYNMGVPGTNLTHAVAVIRVNDGAGDRAIIEDGHFGLSVNDENGDDVDFHDLIARLRDRRHETLRVDYISDTPINCVGPENGDFTPVEIIDDFPPVHLENGECLYKGIINVRWWCENCRMSEVMAERGFPPELIFLCCLPISVFAGGGSETEEAYEIRDRILSILSGPSGE